MTHDPSPRLLALLAPDETVLLHHRADGDSVQRWERRFKALFAGVIVLVWAAQWAIHGDAIWSLWWAMAFSFLAVQGAIHWLFGRVRAQTRRFDAIVTQQRILWEAGPQLALTPEIRAMSSGNAVRLYHRGGKYRLFFPADGAMLAAQINRIIAQTKAANHGRT